MKTGKERQAALRARRQQLGMRRYEYWLTPEEKAAIDKNLRIMRPQKVPELNSEDMHNLRHMVAAGTMKPGYRNWFAPGPGDIASMRRLEGRGLAFKGRLYVGESNFYHATRQGCEAAGLTQTQTEKAMSNQT